nr:unnamed protein product [Spirometra erinaceieuropaei]
MTTYNTRSPAVKRLMREAQELSQPTELYYAQPLEATLELSKSALSPGARVLLFDDLIAIGGTLSAACRLVRKASADPIGCVVLIELTDLNGRAKLGEQGTK